MRSCELCKEEQSEVWVVDGKFYCNECKYVPEQYKKSHTLDGLYNFVDFNTTGKPISFNSKGQWKRHLKKLGMTDDFDQKKDGSRLLKPERRREERVEMFKKEIRQEMKDRGVYDSRKLFIRK